MEENNEINRFRDLLKELFRTDLQDLDFGIYKIMKIKQDLITNFIENDLISIVDSELKSLPAEEIENLRKEVFNFAYEFLSRYYDHSDFIPQPRYGGKDKYMIPYNGQEVELYWATKDSYYVKTTDMFLKYSFIVTDPFNQYNKWTVHFKIKEADIEKNYVKESDKYFILDDNPLEINGNEVNIYFNYRQLTEDEKNKLPDKKTEIEKMLKDEAEKKIIDQAPNDLKHLLGRKIENNEIERSFIRKHLDIYYKKNTSDYFINKNLKKFLTKELENYVKNEILDLNTILKNNLQIPSERTYVARAVQNLCFKIIEQISEIEDFEKKLWEMKKFVHNINYVITLDRIADRNNGINLIKEILKSEGINDQINEWKELGIVDGNFNKEKVLKRNLEGEIIDDNYKYLPIDTKYFKEFEDKILSFFEDIDNELDGLLIHSENYQALNTLLSKFKGKIQTVYIDPPFNKEQNADYLYNVKYKDATWITMLENRIRLGRDLLNEKGSIFVRCDYNGNMYVRMLLNEIFGWENFRNEIIVKRGEVPKGEVNRLLTGTDYLIFYSNGENNFFNTPKKFRQERKWLPMHLPGERSKYELQVRRFFGKSLLPPKGRHWALSQESIDKLIGEGRIRINENKGYIDLEGNRVKGMPEILQEEYEKLNSNWTDIPSYVVPSKWNFPTENSEILLKRVIESTSNEGDLVMDFFLGSATTTAVAHKLKRKWIGIEMGEHFYTVVLPRMKKVLAYDPSGISKEEDVKEKYNKNNAGGFFKYFDLEQYEDSLNNIKLDDKGKNTENNERWISQNLLKYILKYDASGSEIFINRNTLQNPFNFNMNIIENGIEKKVKMDLIETFNLWYGLTVKQIFTEKDTGRKYVFVLGKKDNYNIITIWRDTTDLNYEKDNEFILKILKEKFNLENQSNHINQILINGDSTLNLSNYNIDVKSLDPIFFDLQNGG